MLLINVWLRQEDLTVSVPKCLVSWHLDPLQLGKFGARSPTESIHLRRQPFLSSVQSRRFPSPQSFIFMPPWASTLHPVNLTSLHLNQLAAPPSSAFASNQHLFALPNIQTRVVAVATMNTVRFVRPIAARVPFQRSTLPRVVRAYSSKSFEYIQTSTPKPGVGQGTWSPREPAWPGR